MATKTRAEINIIQLHHEMRDGRLRQHTWPNVPGRDVFRGEDSWWALLFPDS